MFLITVDAMLYLIQLSVLCSSYTGWPTILSINQDNFYQKTSPLLFLLFSMDIFYSLFTSHFKHYASEKLFVQHHLPYVPFGQEVSSTVLTPSSGFYLVNSYLLFKFQSQTQYNHGWCCVLKYNGNLKIQDYSLTLLVQQRNLVYKLIGSNY